MAGISNSTLTCSSPSQNIPAKQPDRISRSQHAKIDRSLDAGRENHKHEQKDAAKTKFFFTCSPRLAPASPQVCC